MLENRKILILCALYNSEKFLRATFESVLEQTFLNWDLMISNDNSNNHTMDIVREYLKKDSRFHLMENHTGRRGSHGNYRNLIINADVNDDSYDYYVYMDDDDLWKHNKLETFVKRAEQVKNAYGEDKPVCFTSNMEIIDEQGRLIDSDFVSTYHYEIKKPVDSFLTHRVFGCNMFFDKCVFQAIRRMMRNPDFSPSISFDNFTYQTAVALDADLSFIPEVLMSYRRHTSNSTKNAVYKITPHYFFQALTQMRKIIRNNAYIARDSIDAIDYILTLNEISPEKRLELLEVREGLEKGGIPAIRMWNKYHIDCGDRIRTVENWITLCLCYERKYMDRCKYPIL